MSDRDWYVRLDVQGVLATGIGRDATDDERALAARSNRFLVDLSAVTEITADALVLAVAPRAPNPRAVRIAVLAPTPLAFGWTRQLMLAGELDPERVSLFRTEDEALAWLESSPATER